MYRGKNGEPRALNLGNGTFFNIRFERDEEENCIDLFQVFDESTTIYVMSISMEDMVKISYELEDMVNG